MDFLINMLACFYILYSHRVLTKTLFVMVLNDIELEKNMTAKQKIFMKYDMKMSYHEYRKYRIKFGLMIGISFLLSACFLVIL